MDDLYLIGACNGEEALYQELSYLSKGILFSSWAKERKGEQKQAWGDIVVKWTTSQRRFSDQKSKKQNKSSLWVLWFSLTLKA